MSTGSRDPKARNDAARVRYNTARRARYQGGAAVEVRERREARAAALKAAGAEAAEARVAARAERTANAAAQKAERRAAAIEARNSGRSKPVRLDLSSASASASSLSRTRRSWPSRSQRRAPTGRTAFQQRQSRHQSRRRAPRGGSPLPLPLPLPAQQSCGGAAATCRPLTCSASPPLRACATP